jgi:hypothetical protein
VDMLAELLQKIRWLRGAATETPKNMLQLSLSDFTEIVNSGKRLSHYTRSY